MPRVSMPETRGRRREHRVSMPETRGRRREHRVSTALILIHNLLIQKNNLKIKIEINFKCLNRHRS